MGNATIDRRNLMVAGALLSAGAAALAPAMATAAGAASPASATGFTPQPLPLPCDPKTVAGLSEKLLVSHHDKNYVGAVKRLGAIEGQIAALDPATAPGFLINGLKREELIAWNSMILHEVYFSGLGAPTRPGGVLAAGLDIPCVFDVVGTFGGGTFRG